MGSSCSGGYGSSSSSSDGGNSGSNSIGGRDEEWDWDGLSHHFTLARNMSKPTTHVTFWAVASHMALQVASESAYKGNINHHDTLHNGFFSLQCHRFI